MKREWIATADCARLLGITPDGVRYLTREGRLDVAATLPNGQRIFSRVIVERYLARRRREQADAVVRSASDAA
jgi:DNA-binding transcriptional MerR regulator